MSTPRHDVCVMLTPRAPGGHEAALLGWLADAVRDHGLRPLIVAPGDALAQACADAGLARFRQAEGHVRRAKPRHGLLRTLHHWSAERPLLLAPGVLHADAWLLATSVLKRRNVWVYVPMAYTAAHMGFRAALPRDRLLAPWLRRVRGWVTLDEHQRHWLREAWGVAAPVHTLPNLPRLAAAPLPGRRPAADGRLRVSYVGRFDPHQKGLDWLSGTLRSDPWWITHCRWRLQGRGPAEAQLRALSAELGAEAVAVHAHAPIDEALAVSDVLLLSSRFEGLPLVALEATARGCPVVATRQSALAQLLPAASQYDFGDAAGLRQALARLSAAPARAAAVAHAQAQLAQLCDHQAYARALQGLLGAWRGASPPQAQPAW